jgi:NAD(P)-dependent dehydrogenase (short-subunit alcohol dehydrogenase family)
MSASIASKIVLITGANQGIGFEIAKSLSSMVEYHVLIGSRDIQRGIDAAKMLQEQGLSVDSITIEYVILHFFLHPAPLLLEQCSAYDTNTYRSVSLLMSLSLELFSKSPQNLGVSTY